MSWKDNVRRVEPYVPGEQPAEKNIIKLNTNENPYPPAPGVQEVLRSMAAEDMRLYPDPAASLLVEKLAGEYHVKKEQVFVGVGSDDVLAMSFLTFFNGNDPILFPDISYSFYEVWAECFRVPYKKIPLTDDWRIDPNAYTVKNGGIIFPNPNAPTGIAVSIDEIRKILDANREVVVIIDEAYIDFGAESALPLLEEYDNLLIVQTFSKSRSMAGMRIGFAFGSEELIRCLSDVRYSVNSYTMNRPSIMAGAAALEDRAYFEKIVGKIINTRDSVRDELEEMGFTCLDSSTNFLFVTHPDISAAELFRLLREKGIYVRYFSLPRIDNYLRIKIGTTKQMQVLLDTLRLILRSR